MAAKKLAKAAVVEVKVDVALKKAWQDAVKRLEAASHEGAKAWDVRYEVVADIVSHQPPLYLAGGFSSDRDFFARHVGEPATVVYRNMRVAQYATPADLETYSASRIDAAITWLETKNGGAHQGHTPIDFARLRFPVVKDGQQVTRPLAEVTVQELRAAIARLKGKKGAKASPVERALGVAVAKSKVKGVTCALHGQTVVLHLPLGGVAKVAAALAGFVPPRGQPGK